MLNRRVFLTGSATLLAAAGAGLGALPIHAAPPELDRALFESLEGTSFALLIEHRVSYCTLREVRDATSDPNLDQFTLVFDHVSGARPGCETVDAWHPQIGVFSIFLDPAGDGYIAPFSIPLG